MQVNFQYTKELLILNNIFNSDGIENLRIVGGAVRNFLLNKQINDFDLSCKLLPEEILKLLKENNIKIVPIGIEFGTILAIINGKSFEITTTRKDIKTDGRHAVVEWANDFRTDAERRDFTFNALYLDFKGNIYDYFNGIDDLKNGVIKFIGNAEQRIIEDYLRILRFFRFYCYYGNILDIEGFKYSIKYKEKLKNLSGERIKAEMFKILISDESIKSLKIMQDNDILYIVTNIKKFNFNNLEILLSIKKYLHIDITPEIILSLLLNNLNELNTLREKWKLSKKENITIFKLLENKNNNLYDEKELKKLLFYGEKRDFLINLVIINSIINNKYDVEHINNMIAFIKIIEIPILPINGEDLINNGFLNKKNFGSLLLKAQEIFLNSNFSLSKENLIKSINNIDF